jgi:hypothetical protein
MENIKKKRGRKPKVKVEEDPPKKKRGRKPKVVLEGEEPKKPLKRGRKPKSPKNIANLTEYKPPEEAIVLHLPINPNKELFPKPFSEQPEYKKVEVNKSIKNEIERDMIENIIEERNNLLNTINNKNLLIEFSECNKKKKWPTKTTMHCFWDGHPFQNQPFGLPMKKHNNELHMFGNFCSPECAAAYNFSLGDSEKWERYSLINEFYSNKKNEAIKIAPSKLLLKEYGGIFSIKEFRKNNINNKDYKLCLPPVVSQIPTLQEVEFNLDGDIVPLNKNKLIHANSEFRLKRQKPVLDNNTLDNIMNLKYL